MNQPGLNSAPNNAMTVDVEDYFQVSAFEDIIARDQWDALPLRVENNTYRILELFEQKKIKATDEESEETLT